MFFWCVLGLGVVVSFVKTAHGFTLLPYLKGVLAQKLIKYLYQRKAKVQNIVMFAVNDHQVCALELSGCHRWLTVNLGSLVKLTFFM